MTIAPPSFTPERLHESLSELRVIPQARLDEALRMSKKDGLPLEEVLLRQDLISDENLGQAVAELLDMPFVRLANTAIDATLLTALPETFARQQGIVLFAQDQHAVHLASSRPVPPRVLESIQKKIGKNLTVYYATPRDVEYALGGYEKDFQKGVERLIAEQGGKTEKTGDNEGDTLVVELIDRLMQYAYNNRASDIHIEPARENALVRLRIDGVLTELFTVPLPIHQRLIARIKYLARLRTDEHMGAQDGKFQMSLEQEDLDVRVSILPVTHGEKCVLRLLALRYRQFALADLGLGEADLEHIRTAASKPYGMILSTGPTGSGKTTSMYAIVKILNTNDRNITTIEDPVEYDIAGINQVQVNERTNLTFAEGLRSILRQDPNIIYVGEIRDSETAGIAVNSALTGHLVLSTLHTNDAATALPRLLEMRVEPYLVASTVTLIIAQRLVRKLCQACRVSTPVDNAHLKQLLPAELATRLVKKEKVRLYVGKGCEACHQTGYKGRIGIFEALVVSPAIRNLIVEKADAETIKRQAVQEGMSTMLSDGLEKALRGETSLEEVLRMVHS